jgi:hypothetical protein
MDWSLVASTSVAPSGTDGDGAERRKREAAYGDRGSRPTVGRCRSVAVKGKGAEAEMARRAATWSTEDQSALGILAKTMP